MSVTILTMMLGTDGLSATTVATDLAVKSDLATHGLFLAQQFQNTDLIANLQTGWADFLQSGKAGALAVGLVIGYTLRGITR
jgi:hypothetical protein